MLGFGLDGREKEKFYMKAETGNRQSPVAEATVLSDSGSDDLAAVRRLILESVYIPEGAPVIAVLGAKTPDETIAAVRGLIIGDHVTFVVVSN
jgi:hypothetical protein